MKKQKEWTEKQRKIYGGLILSAFFAIFAVAFGLIGIPMIRFAEDTEAFRQWVEIHGFGGKIAYVGMVALQVLAAIIPGEPLELVGGYAFGALEGTLLCLLGSSLGTLAVIALVRRFGTNVVEMFFPKEKIEKLHFLHNNRRRLIIFTAIFTVPGTPKDLLCFFAGLTDLPFSTLVCICTLGRLPSIVTSTIGGNAIGTQSYVLAIVVLACTAVISLGGVYLYNKICKIKDNHKKVQDKGEC